jgi:hypothetical protein
VGQAPLAAGLIVFLCDVWLPAGSTAAPGVADPAGAAPCLFWLGFTATAIGLVAAAIGNAPDRARPPLPPVRRGGRVARLITGVAVLPPLCLLETALALAIVRSGMGLKGPAPAMLQLLGLATAVGLFLGLAVGALLPRPLSALALGLLVPIWFLGGQRQPLAAMDANSRIAAQFLPARWAFEGLLLLEADRESPSVPAEPTASASPTPSAAGLRHDLAEGYFPAETERMGVRAATLALAAMLAGLAGLAAFISGARP